MRAFHISEQYHNKLRKEMFDKLPNQDITVALADELNDQLARLESEDCQGYQRDDFAAEGKPYLNTFLSFPIDLEFGSSLRLSQCPCAHYLQLLVSLPVQKLYRLSHLNPLDAVIYET